VAVQLVESVRRDPYRQRERSQTPEQAIDVNVRRERCAEGKIAQMPGGVRRV